MQGREGLTTEEKHIKEVITSEIEHRSNLFRLIEIIEDERFAEYFSKTNDLLMLLRNFILPALKQTLNNPIYKKEPWNFTSKDQVTDELVRGYAGEENKGKLTELADDVLELAKLQEGLCVRAGLLKAETVCPAYTATLNQITGAVIQGEHGAEQLPKSELYKAQEDKYQDELMKLVKKLNKKHHIEEGQNAFDNPEYKAEYDKELIKVQKKYMPVITDYIQINPALLVQRIGRYHLLLREVSKTSNVGQVLGPYMNEIDAIAKLANKKINTPSMTILLTRISPHNFDFLISELSKPEEMQRFPDLMKLITDLKDFLGSKEVKELSKEFTGQIVAAYEEALVERIDMACNVLADAMSTEKTQHYRQEIEKLQKAEPVSPDIEFKIKNDPKGLRLKKAQAGIKTVNFMLAEHMNTLLEGASKGFKLNEGALDWKELAAYRQGKKHPSDPTPLSSAKHGTFMLGGRRGRSESSPQVGQSGENKEKLEADSQEEKVEKTESVKEKSKWTPVVQKRGRKAEGKGLLSTRRGSLAKSKARDAGSASGGMFAPQHEEVSLERLMDMPLMKILESKAAVITLCDLIKPDMLPQDELGAKKLKARDDDLFEPIAESGKGTAKLLSAFLVNLKFRDGRFGQAVEAMGASKQVSEMSLRDLFVCAIAEAAAKQFESKRSSKVLSAICAGANPIWSMLSKDQTSLMQIPMPKLDSLSSVHFAIKKAKKSKSGGQAPGNVKRQMTEAQVKKTEKSGGQGTNCDTVANLINNYANDSVDEKLLQKTGVELK
jgi:hypothetical protein